MSQARLAAIQIWIAAIPVGITPIPTGITPIPVEIALIQTGIGVIPTGIALIPTGIRVIPTGIGVIPTGIALIPTGITPIQIVFGVIPTGIRAIPVGVLRRRRARKLPGAFKKLDSNTNPRRENGLATLVGRASAQGCFASRLFASKKCLKKSCLDAPLALSSPPSLSRRFSQTSHDRKLRTRNRETSTCQKSNSISEPPSSRKDRALTAEPDAPDGQVTASFLMSGTARKTRAHKSVEKEVPRVSKRLQQMARTCGVA